ncbi:IS1634 family transposase [Alicyclobacillus macrosporangiidus]
MESAPMWAQMMRRFGWAAAINDFVGPQTGCKVSVGDRISALLINILTDRSALYRVEDFYRERDVEALIGPGVQAEDLNDDALARALDAIYEAGPDKLFSRLAISTLLSLGVLDRFDDFIPLHADTTSLSVYGEYPGQEKILTALEDPFRIVRGYSKDNQPDLRQIIFGNATVMGIPVYGTVNAGNTDDHTWNHDTISELAKVFTAEVRGKMVYIADSAVVTEANLRAFTELDQQFISRLPSTFKLCGQLKQAAWDKEGAWKDVGRLVEAKDGARYKIQSFRRELYGHRYRFVVVRSSSLDARKEHKLSDVLERERKELEKAATAVSKTLYGCEQDGLVAAEAFCRAHRNKLHRVKTTLEPVEIQEKRTRRGRPRKDEPAPPVVTRYRIQIEIEPPSEDVLQAWREQEATFVLITNIRDDQRLADEAVLRLYKEQAEVEGRFRYLKSPYHVGPIYLHRADRVKAFCYVMLMSLLLYSVFEYILREKMKQEEEPLILPGKRKSFRPTGTSVLEMFDGMITARVQVNGEWRYVKSLPPDPQIERILKLLDMDLSIYYPAQKTA